MAKATNKTAKTVAMAPDLNLQIETLTKERDQNALIATEAIRIANSFNGYLMTMESSMIQNIPSKFNFLKSMWWVLNNFSAIVAFVKVVVEQLKAWRDEINKLPSGPKPE